MPRVSRKEENPFEVLVGAWRESLDATLTATAKTLEASLTSKEFLTLSRHGLELLCGHRDRMAALSGELLAGRSPAVPGFTGVIGTPGLGIPARPTTPRKTKKPHGRRER